MTLGNVNQKNGLDNEPTTPTVRNIKKYLSKYINAFNLETSLNRDQIEMVNLNGYDKSLCYVNNIFFVWIGCIGEEQIRYYDFWSRVNNDTCIFYDSYSFLSFKLNESLCYIHGCNKKGKELIMAQNKFYEGFAKENRKHFDSYFLEYVKEQNTDLFVALCDELNEIETHYKQLEKRYNLIDIRSVDGIFLFSNYDYEQYYSYEVLLRNNLAAASDILRLLILQKFGGMYVDFDTLPNFDHLFCEEDSRFVELSKWTSSQVLKSELILNRFHELNNKNLELIIDTFFKNEKEYVNALSIKAERLGIDELTKAFEIPPIYENTISLSCSKLRGGVFNNNVIISHKNSKIIRIILTEMFKRYRYIEKSGALYCEGAVEGLRDDYWGRFNAYREDYRNVKNNVTLFLTGPSLILETVISIAYELLDIEGICPSVVADVLSNEKFRFAFFDQTQFTLEHMRSSWQPNDNKLCRVGDDRV